MLDDFVKSMRAALYERTASPLFGVLSLSWLLWNYRLVIVLFSGMSIPEKFAYVDDVLYPPTLRTFAILVVGPLITAALVLFVYPYPSKWVFRFWRNRQRELSAIKQEIEDQTPLTIEQAREIRRQVVAIQLEHDRQVQRGSEEEKRLKQAVADRQEQVDKLERELREARAIGLAGQRPRASDEQIAEALRRRPFSLNYYSSKGVRKSRAMLFGPSGKILEGGNDAEHSWRITNGYLETVRADGRVQARFSFFPASNIFIHTNDPDTISSKGQYMIPSDSQIPERN